MHQPGFLQDTVNSVTNHGYYDGVSVNNQLLERVSTAKVLGLIISNNLKWTNHIETITLKAGKCLYLLRQLKRANIFNTNLIRFYCSRI